MDCAVAWATIVLVSLPVFARQAKPREERILEVARRIERMAASHGEAAGVAWLAAAFRVSPHVVTDLRDQKLDLGEMAVVLALAEVFQNPRMRF